MFRIQLKKVITNNLKFTFLNLKGEVEILDDGGYKQFWDTNPWTY